MVSTSLPTGNAKANARPSCWNPLRTPSKSQQKTGLSAPLTDELRGGGIVQSPPSRDKKRPQPRITPWLGPFRFCFCVPSYSSLN